MLKQQVDNIAIYLRLSHDDGDMESESIQNQRKLINDYISEKFNYKNIYEYVDDGYSGSNFNRPDFQRMIKELDVKNINLIITKNLARLGRNYIDSGEYIEKTFPNKGIRYIAILDGVDNFEDKVQNNFAAFKGLFNELHCRETSKALKKTKRKKMQEGYYYCPIPPYGYKHDQNNPGKLVVDKKVAGIVKKIFMMKYKGMTAKQIAEYLNEKHIITPARYMNIFKSRDIDIWTGDGVSKLLSKRVYIGDTCVGKDFKISYKSRKVVRNTKDKWYITENTHEAIIPRDIFFEIHNNNKYNNSKRSAPNVDTLLGNLIYCNTCGRKMSKVNKNGIIVLRCSAYSSSNELCNNSKRHKYLDIERLVLEDLKLKLDDFIKNQQYRKNVYSKYKSKNKKKYDEEKKNLNNEYRKIMFEVSNLYNKRLEGEIDENDYTKMYSLLNSKRDYINKQLEILENENILPEQEKQLKENMKKARKIYKNVAVNNLNKDEMKFLIKSIHISSTLVKVQYNFKK